MIMKFPATIFTVYTLDNKSGWYSQDCNFDLTSAADCFVECLDKDWMQISNARVIRTDFDVETGAPETVRDVTEEAKAEARMWIEARHHEVPDWLKAA